MTMQIMMAGTEMLIFFPSAFRASESARNHVAVRNS